MQRQWRLLLRQARVMQADRVNHAPEHGTPQVVRISQLLRLTHASVRLCETQPGLRLRFQPGGDREGTRTAPESLFKRKMRPGMKMS